MSGTRRVLVAIAALLAISASARATLVLTNGSWESPVASDGSYITVNENQTSGGWTARGDAMWYLQEDYGAGGSTPLAVGNDLSGDGEDDQFLQITNRNDGSWTYQLLGTVDELSDVTLAAQFAWRESNMSAPYPSSVFGLYTDSAGSSALAEGTVTTDLTFNAHSVTASSVAAGTSVYAIFKATGSGSGTFQGLLVDDAQLTVTPVPEPGTLALLALGGAAIALRRRRA